jgi:hypothetical protein
MHGSLYDTGLNREMSVKEMIYCAVESLKQTRGAIVEIDVYLSGSFNDLEKLKKFPLL